MIDGESYTGCMISGGQPKTVAEWDTPYSDLDGHKEFIYRYTDDAFKGFVQHFDWDKNIDITGIILQAWIYQCGIHSAIIICILPYNIEIPRGESWVKYWKDLRFFLSNMNV